MSFYVFLERLVKVGFKHRLFHEIIRKRRKDRRARFGNATDDSPYDCPWNFNSSTRFRAGRLHHSFQARMFLLRVVKQAVPLPLHEASPAVDAVGRAVGSGLITNVS
jgi:hypothetical protein